MNASGTALVVCLATFAQPFCFAATEPSGADPLPNVPLSAANQPAGSAPSQRSFPVDPSFLSLPKSGLVASSFSSSAGSSSLPDAPQPVAGERGAAAGAGAAAGLHLAVKPFSDLAIGFKAGSTGAGVEFATPLASKITLRAGASFFSYNPTLVEDGMPIDGEIKLRTISAGIDLYPYKNSFHITPGVTMYNGNHATGTTFIAAGSSFTLNDTTYTSSPDDPVQGTFDVVFGRKFAPSLTLGFGNMLRRDGHWSVPVDFGFEYLGQPKFTLNMTGSACNADGCGPIQGDPTTVANLQAAQTNVNNSLSALRFYPIASVGVAYRFGKVHKASAWQ